MKTGRMPASRCRPRSSTRTKRPCTSTTDSPHSGGSSTTTACPCGPGSPPHSSSSTRNQSAASFATPSTTSPDADHRHRPVGRPVVPAAGPVADLMRAYIQSRQHLLYASSRSSQWLFPGRQPGQPMNPVSLQVHLREIGSLRSAAGPPRSVSSSSKPRPPSSRRHSAITTRPPRRLVTEAGGTWSRYAPGDHTR